MGRLLTQFFNTKTFVNSSLPLLLRLHAYVSVDAHQRKKPKLLF